MNDLTQQAINSALNQDWDSAKKINLQILSEDEKDLPALNRLAKAYFESGDTKKAIATAKKVIAIDQYNKIALRSLDKWKQVGKSNKKTSASFSAKEFIEEPGKTKIVSLLHIGDAKVVANLDAGDEAVIENHGHRIAVTTQEGKYIGRLPDDLSLRLKKLIAQGNKYKALIKNTEKGEVKVFIKETLRAEKIKDVPSFSPEKIDYIAFTPPNLVHKTKVDTSTNENEEED